MLDVTGIGKAFKGPKGSPPEQVLQDVSFTVGRGEIVSITGKSGAGKSTIARIVCGAISPDAGEVWLEDTLLVSPSKAFSKERRREVQLIPQLPMLSLDPSQRIGDALAEPLLVHKLVASKTQARRQVSDLLRTVWLDEEIAGRYPAQISGGQAQRCIIARALALQPRLLIADEATSMLDILAQAQVVSLLKALVEEQGVSILLISHDRALVEALSNRIYHLEGHRLIQAEKGEPRT